MSAKCAWLEPFYGQFSLAGDAGDARRVLLSAHRKFACPTKELALASFLARKRRQAGIYDARAARAREAIRIATEEALLDVSRRRIVNVIPSCD